VFAGVPLLKRSDFGGFNFVEMEDEDLIIIASATCVIMEEASRVIRPISKQRRRRRWWMTSLFKSREQYRGMDLMNDLKSEMEYGLFQNFCRMNPTDFEFLFNRVAPEISKNDTSFREAIPATERFMLTLRFLASGDSYTSLMYTFKISKQLISRIVPEVCSAILRNLKEYVQVSKIGEVISFISIILV